MADELTITAKLKFDKNLNAAVEMGVEDVTFDVSGEDYVKRTHSVSTIPAALPLGPITTPGYIFIKNLDDAATLYFYAASTGSIAVKVQPGEAALFRVGSTAPYVASSSGSVEFEYLLVEA